MGTYSQVLNGDGTLNFDDYVTIYGGVRTILADAKSNVGIQLNEVTSASYDITLTIIPEPATITLVALGAVAMLLHRCLRRRRLARAC